MGNKYTCFQKCILNRTLQICTKLRSARPEPIILFKFAYYVFEQCSKIFPFEPQLCSIVPNYAVIPLSKSEDQSIFPNYIYFTVVETTKLYN